MTGTRASTDAPDGNAGADADAAVRALLRDAFTRQHEHAEEVTAELPDDVAWHRLTADANSICWLVWHTARMQDAQIAELAGITEVWLADSWVDRFALDVPREAHGYGMSSVEVGKVRAGAELLADYYRAVHEMTLTYLGSLAAAELDRVIAQDWDPPVTVGVRLISVVDDAAQHLGQAAYLRGLAGR